MKSLCGPVEKPGVLGSLSRIRSRVQIPSGPQIEEGRLRILTDPGSYTTTQNDVKNIDIILITHEHPDYFHLDSLKTVLINNPNATIITNKGVGILYY